ncbi:MAG: hydroxysqualene dehydroxylase HpnE [Acidobacteria bacterium]|nr:hydroxysqualene dehydroxylase HpnE [Acidobacteriota bacterium]
MPRVKIVGGGLAGLSAATALAEAGFEVDLHEAKPFLGGRATSYPVHPSEPDGERIDNCQHVLLRCCDNLLDFYRRLGVEDKIRFYKAIHFVRPGGAVDTLERGPLPKPLHLAGSFLRLSFLSIGEKIALIRDLRAIEVEYARREDLDTFTFGEWLRRRGASENVYRRFWEPIVVSALNEDPEIASAKPAFQVFAEGLMGSRTSYEMGVPAVPLADLYAAAGKGVRVHLRSTVERIDPASDEADFYVSAVPFERVEALIPGLGLNLQKFTHSPITGIHLWFDRPITELPHASLLDRTMQWMFRRGERYVQCVVSASRGLMGMKREEIIDLAVRELGEFFPEAKRAKLERAHVVKEARATYSVVPRLEVDRPGPRTKYPNVFLAGDWTDTGWPATMEGAVRSGYRAAEAVGTAVHGALEPERALPG